MGAEQYPLIVIVGPTGSGKSALAVRAALAFGGEVINFDSVQVYRGFDVGSGKLGIEERQAVEHHLLDVAEPGDTFTAGDYRREALKALEDVRSRGALPILTGGTGLYLRALLVGLFEGPTRSDALRRRLDEMADLRGREFLHRVLARKDPETAARIHPRDTQKIVRALEVCLIERRPFSELLGRGRESLKGFRICKIGLAPPRPELTQRIDRRVEQMFDSGITEEVQRAIERPKGARIAPLGALGYRQALSFVEGDMSREQAIRETQLQTRQYAKRQMTWFKREPGVHWFSGFGDDPAIDRQVLEWLARALAGDSSQERGPAASLFQLSGI